MASKLYAASESGDVKALENLGPDVLHGLTPAQNNALRIAAYHGHLEFVKTLLPLWKENPEVGIDITHHIIKGMDPKLYAASESGDVKALENLGPDVLHGLTPAQNNALHRAAYHGHLEFVKTLLPLWKENPEVGIDKTHHIIKGMDPKLYVASEKGNVNDLENFGPDVLHGLTPAGNSALHIAAYHGHQKFVRTLLRRWKENSEAGIDLVTAKNMEGNTALHEAARRGHHEVLKYLLDERADLAFQLNNNGESALFKAAEEGREKVLEKLLEVKLLEEKEEEYYKRRSDGQTALHRAVARLHTGVVEKLLEKRPQLANESDIHSRTPLHFAGLIPIIIPVLVPSYGVLHRPSSWTKVEQIANLLIQKDTDLKRDIALCYRVDENEQSALHLAARSGNMFVIKEILDYSKDCLEMVDKDGKNALHLAVENASEIYRRVGHKHMDIISSLTVHRLINCADNSGKTALDIAHEQIDKAMKQSEKAPPLFKAIIIYLRRQGGTSYIWQKTDDKSSSTPMYDSEMLSVSASLMATAAFTAVSTLPGGLKTNGPPTPALVDAPLFKAFVIFDTLAFVYSAAATIMLVFARQDDRAIKFRIGIALWVAAVSLALTFGLAIHLVVAPECFWLAVIVWVMVACFPLRVLQVAHPALLNNEMFTLDVVEELETMVVVKGIDTMDAVDVPFYKILTVIDFVFLFPVVSMFSTYIWMTCVLLLSFFPPIPLAFCNRMRLMMLKVVKYIQV